MKEAPPPPRRTVRYLRRIGVCVFGVLAALAALGASYQQIGQVLDHHAVTAPGRMVNVDGISMHLHCSGTGAPIIVLEAGAIGFAQMWGWVQPRLAAHTRVCSYDRAGLGWSEETEEHDGVSTADRLRALLEAAGEPGPYVLVGHSMGGAFIRIFAERYPDSVVALAFIDPSHPDQLDRLPAGARVALERTPTMLSLATNLSYIGVMRAFNPLGRHAAGLPPGDDRAARMFGTTPRHLRASRAELIAWDATMKAARANRTLGDRPVVVVSATKRMTRMSQEILEMNLRLHAELAMLSTRGRHELLEGGDHFSVLTEREHAERVAQLLGEMLAELN